MTNKNILDKLIRIWGLKKLKQYAALGEIFIPDEVSLHLDDDNYSSDTSITLVPTLFGIVGHDRANSFGEIHLPLTIDRILPDFRRHEREKYQQIVNSLESNEILRKEPHAYVLRLGESDNPKIRVISEYDNNEPVYSPHNGAIYFRFSSPLNSKSRGRISLHRGLEKTLKLYSQIYHLKQKS